MSPCQCVRLPYHHDSRALYAGMRRLSWPVWLDSGAPATGHARYDVLAADPYLSVTARDGVVRVAGAARSLPDSEHPFALLRAALGQPSGPNHGLPFCGGAIGFLGYDLGRYLGQLPARDGLPDWPAMAVGIYDWAIVVDHVLQRSWFVRQGRDPRPDAVWEEVLRRARGTSPQDREPLPEIRARSLPTASDRTAYARAFARIQRYIRDGDCYQVNYARHFRARVDSDAWTLYQRMRARNPAPYGALLEYPFGDVLSSSPEQFLRLLDGRVTTRPIKGTRPRGGDAVSDRRLRDELVDSSKDRAENVMIVDLLRNDLGKVCVPGSVAVPELFRVESFATVHHLVSTVTGRLRDDCDAIDLLEACFPGGSITGAPKRRAMQIIDELEPVRREVYCGSVIRLGFDGNLDSSITIRTALRQGLELHYWAGGGIVADSECDAEFQESLDKAAAFLGLFG